MILAISYIKGDYILRKIGVIFLSFIITFSCIIFNVTTVSAAGKPTVIVIDPGHGGSNMGTEYLQIPEKQYNMTVALYMKQELEKYNNVKVYLTHTADVDMSLKERAQFAKNVNADFLFSLHFNMSSDHTLYGSEVWIPSSGTYYSKGYSAGYEFLKGFSEMGIFDRGIKTRVGKTDHDYYGIIRQNVERGIPAIIVEHCHVDNPNDAVNLVSDEKLREFGKKDAEAVARYFSLPAKDSSAVDYSNYAPLAIPVPASRVYQDATAPVYVNASLISYDKNTKYASFRLSALDQESYLQYYSYSLDNGITWSAYQPWLAGSNNMTVKIKVNSVQRFPVLFRVSNQYDKFTDSNPVTL